LLCWLKSYCGQGCFTTFAPKIFDYCKATLKKLFSKNKGTLVSNFSNSIYPAVTFNCGPDTACLEHVDDANTAYMLCAVTSLGDYDPTKGGHLVVHPLQKFYQFPPGSTILLPSALVAHGNTPVAKGETRMSVTQYCSGGLLRWVEYGFRMVGELLSTPQGNAEKEKIDGPPGAQCAWALNMFSKLEELLPSRRAGKSEADNIDSDIGDNI
jgi:hypothetical protein